MTFNKGDWCLFNNGHFIQVNSISEHNLIFSMPNSNLTSDNQAIGYFKGDVVKNFGQVDGVEIMELYPEYFI